MNDVVTYSDDTVALIAEVEQVAPHFIVTDENGNKRIYPLTKTPTQRNGNETLAVVRDLPPELHGLQYLTVIGTVALDNSAYTIDAAHQATFDRVYPRTTIPGPDGDYIPPAMFGVIAR